MKKPDHRDEDLNPYRSPEPVAQFPLGADPASEVHASLVAGGWVYRKILLPGRVEAVVEYNGRGLGYETVLVDGKLVARDNATWTLAPAFHFTLPAGGEEIPATIEVRGVLTLEGFRLWVDDRLVYAEGKI